jgi:hypothetical protein
VTRDDGFHGHELSLAEPEQAARFSADLYHSSDRLMPGHNWIRGPPGASQVPVQLVLVAPAYSGRLDPEEYLAVPDTWQPDLSLLELVGTQLDYRSRAHVSPVVDSHPRPAIYQRYRSYH